jgi:hypothetical protein
MTLKRGTGTNRRGKNKGPSRVELIIHHHFPGTELISPICDGHHATCHLQPDRKVNVGSTTQASFNIKPSRKGSFGALMYKLQKKNPHQSNHDVIFGEKTTHTQLVVIWKADNFSGFLAVTYIIEHDKSYGWSKKKLKRLIRQYKLAAIQHVFIEETWLMRDHTVFMTSLNTVHEEKCYKLEMIISEGSMKYDTQRSFYAGPKSSVLWYLIRKKKLSSKQHRIASKR